MYSAKKTKIVATVGPSSEDGNTMKKLIEHGVNVFRFNMKHNDVEWHQETIEKLQRVADKLGISIGILIDLQGPELRIQTKNQAEIILKQGDVLEFAETFRNPNVQVCVPHKSVLDTLAKGDRFSIDDGFVRFKVTKKGRGKVWAQVLDDSTLKHMKTLNLFGKDIKLPSLIKDDINRLSIGASQKIDYVALSFTRTKEDIQVLRKNMAKKKVHAQVIAKIESQKAIDNINEIIAESDVVMVARGDLGIETPIEKLAYYQKMIINKCRAANTPVIVATQMLESMVERPIPTRAEVTDVANAVLDGADALMLSGETAIGKYPVRAVNEMSKIAMFNEKKTSVIKFDVHPDNATELIVEAAETVAEKAEHIGINYLVVFTETGYTAKVLSSFRSKIPVYAITDKQKTVEELTLSFGVTPIKIKLPSGKLLSPDYVINKLKQLKRVKKGDTLLIIHGQHWKQPGQTNAIVLINVP